MNILIVDDGKDPIKRLKEKYQLSGHKVESAQTLKEAKQKIERAPGSGFDLIISDFDLAKNWKQKHRMLDGLRLLRWCKKKKIKSKFILHSKGFDRHRRIISRLNYPLILWSRRLGAQVQGKRVLLPQVKKPH